jgi:ribose 5-phosphate isomerase B
MTTTQPQLAIGSDHAAVELKAKICDFLAQRGLSIEDIGPYDDQSVDYPDYGKKVARMVSERQVPRGILMCGTGLGMSMVANRFPGVRAALCNDLFSAIMSRRHNDANILVMGGRVVGDVLAMEIARVWLDTPFEGGRHQKRLDLIETVCTSGKRD